MANLFKGMSQTNFLDNLVEATGKNGHELFDYLMEILPKAEEKKAEIKDDEPFFPVGTYTFTGDYEDLKAFYIEHGGDPKKAKFMGGSVPGYAACHVAQLLKKERFEWILPTRIWLGLGESIVDGWAKYSCWYVFETGMYEFDHGEIVEIS